MASSFRGDAHSLDPTCLNAPARVSVEVAGGDLARRDSITTITTRTIIHNSARRSVEQGSAVSAQRECQRANQT